MCRAYPQVLAKGGWAGLDDVTKLLPGPTFAEHKAQSVKGTSESECGFAEVEKKLKA